jgi:hypothetical protein
MSMTSSFPVSRHCSQLKESKTLLFGECEDLQENRRRRCEFGRLQERCGCEVGGCSTLKSVRSSALESDIGLFAGDCVRREGSIGVFSAGSSTVRSLVCSLVHVPNCAAEMEGVGFCVLAWRVHLVRSNGTLRSCDVSSTSVFVFEFGS